MREDHLEQLDNMFPNGYVIVYTLPDDSIRLNLYNPHKDISLYRYHRFILEGEA